MLTAAQMLGRRCLNLRPSESRICSVRFFSKAPRHWYLDVGLYGPVFLQAEAPSFRTPDLYDRKISPQVWLGRSGAWMMSASRDPWSAGEVMIASASRLFIAFASETARSSFVVRAEDRVHIVGLQEIELPDLVIDTMTEGEDRTSSDSRDSPLCSTRVSWLFALLTSRPTLGLSSYMQHVAEDRRLR